MMTLQSTRTTPNQPSQHNRSRLSPASGTTPTDAQMNATNNNNQQHSDAAEKRVTIMVACMIGAFMAAWTPYSIMALIETFYGVNSSDRVTSNDATSEGLVNEVFVGHITPALATVPSLFAKTSAVINPLIYGLLNTQFRSAWERFTVRCLGRQPRHHHHNRRRRHNDSNCPDTVAVTNERHNLRRFLGLQPTQTIHLPMKDIAPSSSVYVMVTRAVSDTSPPTPPTSQWHPHQDQTPNGDSSHHEVIQDNKESNSPRRQHHEVPDRSLWLTNSCVPSLLLPCSTATPSSPSPPLAPPDVEPRRSAVAAKELPNRCSLLVRHRPNQRSQQPVSLVVVRLLSDSTSRYNDDIDDSVLETSIDVDSVSPKTRTPEIAQDPPVTDGNTVPGSLSPVRDGPS